MKIRALQKTIGTLEIFFSMNPFITLTKVASFERMVVNSVVALAMYGLLLFSSLPR